METVLPSFVLTTFTPAESVGVTGVALDYHRNWRRWGHLPNFEKHARFKLPGLCRLKVMGAMANLGIGPAISSKVAVEAAYKLALEVVVRMFDIHNTEGPVDGLPELMDEIKAELARDPHVVLQNGEFLPDYYGHYCLCTSDGEVAWIDELSDIDSFPADVSAKLRESMKHTAFAFFSLEALAEQMLASTAKPFIQIAAASSENDEAA